MKAMMFIANGFQDQEAVYPYYRLQEAGFEMNITTPDGKPAKGIIGITLPHDPYSTTHQCDLLVIPGGVKAMEKLRLSPLVEDVRKFHESGKVIAAICSGAQMLISADLCRGRAISAYPAMKVDVENAGGEYRNAVTSCDRIVTAPHYRDLGAWMSMVFRTIHDPARAN